MIAEAPVSRMTSVLTNIPFDLKANELVNYKMIRKRQEEF